MRETKLIVLWPLHFFAWFFNHRKFYNWKYDNHVWKNGTACVLLRNLWLAWMKPASHATHFLGGRQSGLPCLCLGKSSIRRLYSHYLLIPWHYSPWRGLAVLWLAFSYSYFTQGAEGYVISLSPLGNNWGVIGTPIRLIVFCLQANFLRLEVL